MLHMNNGIYTVKHSRYRSMQYISLKEDVIEVKPYAMQLFHRVKCVWLKGQVHAATFI